MKVKTKSDNLPSIELPAELQQLISEAYRIFTHSLNGKLNVCSPCCISEEQVRELIITPVSELSLSIIYDYLDAVHYDEAGYEIKHFLPRILEFLAGGFDLSHSTELMLQRCHFKKNCWQETELDFMNRFSSEFIKYVLTNSTKSKWDNAISYILMFDLAELPTEHLLKIWEEMLPYSRTAFQHFQDFMYYYIDYEGYYSNSFSHNPDFNNQVRDWVTSEGLAKKVLPFIEKEYFENQSLTYEDCYHLDILYTQMERNLN